MKDSLPERSRRRPTKSSQPSPKPEDRVRLQKYLADSGVCARRKAEKLIEQGRVAVNGQVVTTLGATVNAASDRVHVNRKLVRPQLKGVLLLHKPRGVISTLSDPEGRKCLADYLGKPHRGYFPAGRLDWDSSGLVVLTNDGELAERLLHPRFVMPRVYQVRVKGRLSEAVCQRLCEGIKLFDGLSQFSSLKLMSDEEDSTWVEVELTMGKNRIIRRMFEHIGHPVIKLKRISHGPFRLGTLPAGRMRLLTEKEYRQVRAKVMVKRSR